MLGLSGVVAFHRTKRAMSDRIDHLGPDGFQVGASFGRYRRWRNLEVDSEEQNVDTQEDLAIVLRFEACGREDVRVGFAMALPPRRSSSIGQEQDEQESAQDQVKEEMEEDTIKEETDEMCDIDETEVTTSPSGHRTGNGQGDQNQSQEQENAKTADHTRSTRIPTGWVYELGIGSNGNTEILWRKNIYSSSRRVPPKEITLLQLFTGRTCSETEFIKYWVVIHGNTLAFGIGDQIGQDLVAKCVETPEHFKQVERVAFTSWKYPVGYRNVSFEREKLPFDLTQITSRQIVREDPYGTRDLLTPRQRQEYLQECEQAQKRVERFGGEYRVPDIKKFLDSKVVRLLQRTGSTGTGTKTGFVTGFDITCEEEKAKRAKRMERFQTPQFGVDLSKASIQAMEQELTQEQWQQQQEEQAKLARRAQKFGETTNEARLKFGDTKWKELLRPATEKVLQGRRDADWENASVVSQKQENALHLYCLEDHFQQVRTKDILEYFAGYGPSYVEWLDNFSCTVVFHETYTASRALIALSEEIPRQKKMKATESASKSKDQDGDETMQDDTSENLPKDSAATGLDEQDDEADDDAFNGSKWRFATPIKTTNALGGTKEWRVLLREATLDDFPAEKQHKRYHQRSNGGGNHPSRRYSGQRDSRKRRRSGPYDRPNAHRR